ncbi:MAG: nickel-dependent hydrogenase large subunit [Phycisphaerales bacterium]
MPTTIKIDPVTRIEGHLSIEVTVDAVNGRQQITDAKSNGTVFRGFETILKGRDPLDATHITQRICGVCPISHGMASTLTLEKAFLATAPANGRIIRNLVLGANFIQSHVLHFYHLAALDYINTQGAADIAPWIPRYVTPDMVSGNTAVTLVNHYVDALAIRRKAHQMGAIFGGRMPCTSVFVPGGATEKPTAEKIAAFRALLSELRSFIDSVMIPDVNAVAAAFPQYYGIGRGCGNLLAYGVFDLDANGTTKLLKSGRFTNNQFLAVDPAQIMEYVKYSKYTAASGSLNPTSGVTEPSAVKAGAYSWIKAPRYQNLVHEVGPLARMYVNGDYRNGISVLDRLAARVLETKKVADAMDGWLNQLVVGQPVYQYAANPNNTSGIGLTEAPRGALGHWTRIVSGRIDRYQVITPTNWNASPKDDFEQRGPIEQALVGTPVADLTQPIEVLRIIHSFDPCLSCAVHMVRPDSRKIEATVCSRPSI